MNHLCSSTAGDVITIMSSDYSSLCQYIPLWTLSPKYISFHSSILSMSSPSPFCLFVSLCHHLNHLHLLIPSICVVLLLCSWRWVIGCQGEKSYQPTTSLYSSFLPNNQFYDISTNSTNFLLYISLYAPEIRASELPNLSI